MAKAFLDTNVLAYAADRRNPEKQGIARRLLRDRAKAQTGVISTQVLQEYYVVATAKLGFDPVRAKRHVRKWQNFELITVSCRLIEEAIDISMGNQISFWDSLILGCARSAQCEQLLTEDMNDGQMIHSVRIVNPFGDLKRKGEGG